MNIKKELNFIKIKSSKGKITSKITKNTLI